MRKLILNEKKYIENILKNKTVDLKEEKINIMQIIFMIACLYNGEEYIVLSKLKELELDEYDEFSYSKSISKTCDIVKRYKTKLKDSDSIPLYKKEYDKIMECKNDRYKKLLFTCYIMARYINKQSESGSYKIDPKYTTKTIFDLANVSGTKIEKNLLISDLWEKGYISQNYINDDNSLYIRLSDSSDEIVYEVKKLKNLGNQIIAFYKDNYIMCEKCGRLVKIKSKTKINKYCNKCAYNMNLEKQKERDLKKKANN